MASANSAVAKLRETSTYMDSELGPSIFEEPVCLIDYAPDGKLVVNEKAVCQLMKIEKTINCVAIVGLYRTGKSYLLNRLAGKYSGFPVGSTIESKTKGIWMWCIPHPHHDDQVLVLLDTEGLGDMDKGNRNHDNWIFALAVLLSSTLVYNGILAIDRGAIEKLNFMTEISKHIKTKENGSESKDFQYYFPNFVFCLRDFYLLLKVEGQDVTPDEYLEHALEYKKGSDEIIAKYNEPRKCIKTYFKNRKCFTFDRPGKANIVQRLEELTDSDLDEDFVASVEKFRRYIYRECPAKKLDIGTPVTGRMFASLLTSYVNAIINGAVPCIENALNTMAQLENTKAVAEGVKLYNDFMTKNISLPTNSDDILSQVHHKALEESDGRFMKMAIYDTDQKYQRKMREQIMENLSEWTNQNKQASAVKCWDLLQNLDIDIAKKFDDKVYFCIGGYTMHQHDLHTLQGKYDSTGGLGVKAKDILLEFLKGKRAQGKAILEVDEKLNEQRQKDQEDEREKQVAALKLQHSNDFDRMKKRRKDLGGELKDAVVHTYNKAASEITELVSLILPSSN